MGYRQFVTETPSDIHDVHAFWDNLLGTGTSTRAAINAARNVDDAPAGSASNQDVHAWLVESSEIAKASAYKSPIGPSAGPFTLTDAYKRQAKKIAKSASQSRARALANC